MIGSKHDTGRRCRGEGSVMGEGVCIRVVGGQAGRLAGLERSRRESRDRGIEVKGMKRRGFGTVSGQGGRRA